MKQKPVTHDIEGKKLQSNVVDKMIDTISKSAEATEGKPKKKSRLFAWTSTLAMFLISALIISFFLKDVEWKKVIDASKSADLIVAILASTITWVFSWMAGTIISQKVVQWFHKDLPFWDYLWIRGATLILQLIHPTVRSGTELLYQKRKAGISWQRLLGTKLFLVGTVGWAYTLFFILATLVYQLSGYEYKPNYLIYIIWFVLLVPGVGLFTLTVRFFWLKKDFLGIAQLIVRPAHSKFWLPFENATFKHWAIIMTLVILIVVVHCLAVYYRNIAFGVEVPIIFLLGTFALASIISDLPIGYAGFGTTTMAWMYFYGDYGSKEQIVALTLFTPAIGLVLKGLIGGLCLKLGVNAFARINERSQK